MVLYFIGLGLHDEQDITLRGLNAIKNSKHVFLEKYTAILMCDKNRLEALYDKKIIEADREMVEMDADRILLDATEHDVSFLVVGDPFGATTHTDLLLRAREKGVKVRVIHNASVMNAVGACGLSLYRFGETVSIVFFSKTWRPDSFYDKICENRRRGLHTLCLLDIKVKEPNLEMLARGKTVYEPPRYMTVNQCLAQLLELEEEKQQKVFDPNTTLCIGISRLQAEDQQIVAGSMKELLDVDFGLPLHCMVIAGEMSDIEQQMVDVYRVSGGTPRLPVKAEEGEESENDLDDGVFV